MAVRLTLDAPLDLRGELSAALYDKKSTDVRLLGDKGDRVDAHRCVLGICSPLFAALFEEDEFRFRDSVYISLPGYSRTGILMFIKFLYTGVARVPSGSSAGDEFMDLCRLLKIQSAIEEMPDDDDAPESEWVEPKTRPDHSRRSRKSEEPSRSGSSKSSHRRPREKSKYSKDHGSGKASRSRHSSDGRVSRTEEVQRPKEPESSATQRRDDQAIIDHPSSPVGAELEYKCFIAEPSSLEINGPAEVSAVATAAEILKPESEENLEALEAQSESEESFSHQESTEEIERFMLSKITEEIDQGAETEDPPELDSEDERKAEAEAAALALEEAQAREHHHKISKTTESDLDGFQMPNSFDFPIEDLDLKNRPLYCSQSETAMELEAVPSTAGYCFGQPYNIEYNSDDDDDEKYYKRSVLDKKRRRALQIMSVNDEKEKKDVSENCPSTSKQKVGSTKKASQSRKKNSRERKDIDDFICRDDEIEYERHSRKVDREVSSSSGEDSNANEAEAIEESKKSTQKTRRVSGAAKKSQKKRTRKKKISQSDDDQDEEDEFRSRYFDDMLEAQPRKTITASIVGDEVPRIFELKDIKILPKPVKAYGGNLSKKRRRIKPMCDSSEEESSSVRKKSEGSSKSSKISKEEGRSSHESSTSSEDEDYKKKKKKRFVSTGNESAPKTGNFEGNIFSRSKSVDHSSKFGVLNKKKSPELVNRQHSFAGNSTKPRPAPSFNPHSHSYGLSHENKLLAENRANRPEKIQEIMKKNFKKKPSESKDPSSSATSPPENINSIAKGPGVPAPVSTAGVSIGIQQPTITQTSFSKVAENDYFCQGPIQKLMPRPPSANPMQRPLLPPMRYPATGPPPRISPPPGFSRPPPPFVFGPEQHRSRPPGQSPHMFRLP